MIALIRFPLVLVYLLLMSVVLLLMFLCRPFHRHNQYWGGRLYSSVIGLLGLRIEVDMPPSAAQGGPYIFVSNHQSNLDIFIIGRVAPRGTVTVGKKSLAWIPLFGQLYWLAGNILIDRKRAGRAHDTMTQTLEKVRNEKLSVWLFPEGTRSKNGLLPFKSGAFRLAQQSNAPVVAVSVSSLKDKFRWNRWHNGVIKVKVSEPQPLDASRSAKAWSGVFREQMGDTIEQLDTQVAERQKAG